MNTTKKKILLLITRGTVGGAQSVVLNLAKELNETGEDVSVSFGDGEYLGGECKKSGIKTHRFSSLRRSMNPFQNLLALVEIKKHLNEQVYDVVHIHSSNALVGAISARLSKTRTKVVFTVHGLSFLDEGVDAPLLVKVLYKHAMRLLLKFVHKIVYVSQANLDAAKRLRLTNIDGIVIHNGLRKSELSFLYRAEARKQLSESIGKEIRDETFLIGSIGRLDMAKNYEFLIGQAKRIISAHPEVKIVLIGDGPKRDKLEELIRKNDLAEHFILAGEFLNASSYLKAFDTFTLTSRYEGFSIAILEALSAGIPILASDVGGAREQLPYEEFQIYPSGDEDVFQEKIGFIIDNPSERVKFAEENMKTSEDFSMSKTAKAYSSVYCSDEIASSI